MIIQVFQHVSLEGPAYIEEIASLNNHDIHVCRFDEGEQPVPPTDFDLLVIMGGPMSINDESDYPWLTAEKKAIEQAIRSEKIVFGFCLGAQLIADVLGARVFKNPEKEIGWFTVKRNDPGTGNPPLHFLPDIATVFHWHGETFDLPKNSTKLYSSEITENQAFIYENNVIALQFHLEMQKKSIEDLIHFCKSDLSSGRYVMTPADMLKEYSKYESSNKKILRSLFRYFEKDLL